MGLFLCCGLLLVMLGSQNVLGFPLGARGGGESVGAGGQPPRGQATSELDWRVASSGQGGRARQRRRRGSHGDDADLADVGGTDGRSSKMAGFREWFDGSVPSLNPDPEP